MLFYRRYISHNPLDCDHVTTHTLKHLMRETTRLKSFDGHKIKCQRMVPLMTKRTRGKLNLLQLLCQNTNSSQVLPYTFYSISSKNPSNHHVNHFVPSLQSSPLQNGRRRTSDLFSSWKRSWLFSCHGGWCDFRDSIDCSEHARCGWCLLAPCTLQAQVVPVSYH